MTPSKTNIYLAIKLKLEAVISVAFKLEPTHSQGCMVLWYSVGKATGQTYFIML